MTRLGKRRGAALLAATIVVVGLAVGAFAYWMGAGTGTATTVLGTPVQLTIEAGTPQAHLVPGRTAGVAVAVTNQNPYFVRIPSLSRDTADGAGGFEVDTGHSGCDLSALHMAPQDNGGAGWRIPPRIGETNGTLAIDIAGALSMDADAADACQGATFTVYLDAGA